MSIIELNEEEIRYKVSQIKELPPLPLSLKRLIEIIYSESDSPGELESIIQYDPALVAKVLMIANSAYYGARSKVDSISRAITVIGADQVKSICICTLLINQLSRGDLISKGHRETLWKHAFASSRIARELSVRRPWISRSEASMLGLLHDLGWIVMATYFSEQFVAILETSAKRKIPPWHVETAYGLDHGRLGKFVACRWALPEIFQAAMEFHHYPHKSKSFSTEVKFTHLVDILSHSLQYPEMVCEDATLSFCRDLYISENEWQECQEYVETIWPDIDQLWTLLGI